MRLQRRRQCGSTQRFWGSTLLRDGVTQPAILMGWSMFLGYVKPKPPTFFSLFHNFDCVWNWVFLWLQFSWVLFIDFNSLTSLLKWFFGLWYVYLWLGTTGLSSLPSLLCHFFLISLLFKWHLNFVFVIVSLISGTVGW